MAGQNETRCCACIIRNTKRRTEYRLLTWRHEFYTCMCCGFPWCCLGDCDMHQTQTDGVLAASHTRQGVSIHRVAKLAYQGSVRKAERSDSDSDDGPCHGAALIFADIALLPLVCSPPCYCVCEEDAPLPRYCGPLHSPCPPFACPFTLPRPPSAPSALKLFAGFTVGNQLQNGLH